jgi:hypothetical protein
MIARRLALAIAGAFAVSALMAGPAQAVCDPHCAPKANKSGEVRGVNMASTGGTMPPPNRISTSLVALVLSLAGPAVEEPPTLAPAEPVERVIQAAEQRNCPAPVANRNRLSERRDRRWRGPPLVFFHCRSN